MSHSRQVTIIPKSSLIQFFSHLGCGHEPKRLSFLETHLQNLHPGILNSQVLFAELKPTYAPLVVDPPNLPPLPALPTVVKSAELLAVKHSSQKRPHINGAATALSRKWSRLTAQDKEEKEDNDEITVDLEDLLAFPRQKDTIFNLVSRRKPPESQTSRLSNLSHPPPMADTLFPDMLPPLSIGYDAFALKADEQEARMADAAAFAVGNGTAARKVTIQQPS